MLLVYDLFNHYKSEAKGSSYDLYNSLVQVKGSPLFQYLFGAIPLVIPWGFHHLKVGGFNMFQSFKIEKKTVRLRLATCGLVLTISIANGYLSQPIRIANGRGSGVQCHHIHVWKKRCIIQAFPQPPTVFSGDEALFVDSWAYAGAMGASGA